MPRRVIADNDGRPAAPPRDVRRRSADTLTGQQRFQLKLGSAAGMEFAFGTLEAAERAWFACRHELMERSQTGRWPNAYWVFELGADPPLLRSRRIRAVDLRG
jgi:hypothetical protein